MRRIVLVLLVLAVGVAIARAPVVRPSLGGALLARAHELAVYRAGRAPVAFPLPAGRRALRLLVNLDVAPPVPEEGVPFEVRVAIPEDGFVATFPLVAAAAADPSGAPAAFYLGEPRSPARTRELALERGGDGPATALVSLASPAGATASVRLLVSEDRPPLARELLLRRPGPQGWARLASSLGPLDWDQLDDGAREDLLARRWVRVPAAPGTASRRLYLLGAPATAPPQPPPAAVDLGPGRVATFTVRGPGTLQLAAAAPLDGEARVLAADGAASAVPLHLAPGERASVPIGAGIVTVRVSGAAASEVRALGDARMALDPTRARTLPGGDAELGPVWSVETDPVAGPAAPVAWDLSGRGGAELRLVVRALAAPGAAEARFRVRWRMLDGHRAPLAEGELPLSAKPAPEDRIDGDPDHLPTEPAVAYLWPPPDAARLELSSDARVAVGASSPGFPPDAGGGPALADGVLLRFQREDRPAWFRVRPEDEPALWRSDRMVTLRSAMRVEEAPEPPPPALPAETLAPAGSPPRHLLLVPAPEADSRERSSWWPVSAGVESGIVLERPAGAGADARVQPSLLYAGDASFAGSGATVAIDGRASARLAIYSARGQIALPPLAPGAHRLRVEAGAPVRLFLDRPVAGAPLHRAYGVYELAPGAGLRVRLAKKAASRSLGVALYFDGAPSPEARLSVTVDGAARAARPGSASLGWTRLRRAAPVKAEPAPGALYLDRTSPAVWAAAPIFVPLHDDLRAGTHEIAIAVERAGARAFARFFAYGAAAPEESVRHVAEIHAESPP